MANYRFVFSTGQACNYIADEDTKAFDAAKEYVKIMKAIDFHVGYVRVYKYIGKHRYSLIGNHEV